MSVEVATKVQKKYTYANPEFPVDSVGYFDPKDCVEVVDHMGSDITVVNAARVSFSAAAIDDPEVSAANKRLTKFLAKHNHISPFYHAMVQLRIRMPFFVKRQWDKHQIGLSRNEESRRYITRDVDCYLPQVVREVHENKKQGSKDTAVEDNDECLKIMKGSFEFSLQSYRELLKRGTCPEQARIVLPFSSMCEFIETGSLAAYARIYGLRNHPEAQKEIRDYAIVIGEKMAELFPVAWDALINKGE